MSYTHSLRTFGIGLKINLTICLRVIRNAWHFYHALCLVFKVACGSSVLRCSHLNRALGLKGGLSGIIRTSSVIIRGGCR